jgi:hypothetical protein
MSVELPGEPTPERKSRSAFVSAPAIGTEAGPARAGHRMFRALSTIERLRRDSSLSSRQAEAGERLRDDYELGVEGARDDNGKGGYWGWSFPEAQLNALRRYQLAVLALGQHIAGVVQPVCCGTPGGGDVTLQALARKHKRNRQEIAGILKVGLDMLADHYGMR